MVLTLDAACATKWCKLIDYKNLTSDNGFYTDPGNREALWVGGQVATGSALLGTSAVDITISRDAGGTVNGYLNGALQFTYNDTTNAMVFDGANNIMWFLQDEGAQGNPGEHPKGFGDSIKIYNTAQAPLGTAPEPASVLLCLGGLAVAGALKLRRRWCVAVT